MRGGVVVDVLAAAEPLVLLLPVSAAAGSGLVFGVTAVFHGCHGHGHLNSYIFYVYVDCVKIFFDINNSHF
jgi:hypothetical protein